jgi:nucleoid-associated protein YgaU
MIPFAVRIIAIPVIALAAAIGAFIYVRAPGRTPVAAAVPQSSAPAGPQAENRAIVPQAGAPQSTAALPSATPPSATLPSATLPSAAPPRAGSPGPASQAGGAKPPEFDIVRVTPSGETVVAGRAPGAARVELLDQGKVIGSEKVDQNGQFVLLPPALSGGDHLLALRITPEGQAPVSSTQSVAVAVRPGTGPLVTLAEPGKPSVVLAAPGPAAPAAGPTPRTTGPKPPATTAAPASAQVTIQTAEVEGGGRFFATGMAPADSTVRLYLNGSHVADAAAASDGKWSLTINKGVRGGKYALRADAVGEHGKVISRAEVPFDAPVAIAAAGPVPPTAQPKPAPSTVIASRAEQTGTTPAPASQTAAASAPPAATPTPLAAQPSPATAASKAPAGTAPAETRTSVAASNPAANPVVPEVSTVTVIRGDSLWRISRLRLGNGMRYTVIYEANSGQIRNPNLIYSGQVFVLPGK